MAKQQKGKQTAKHATKGDYGEFACEDFAPGEERILGILIGEDKILRIAPASGVQHWHATRERLAMDYYFIDEAELDAKDLKALERFEV